MRAALAVWFLFPVSTSFAASIEDVLRPFAFRSLGPAVTGGRIVDIEAHPSKPYTIYAASASGGVWKTTNNGTTWTPIFDDQESFSIGDIAIAQTDPKIVWVGTGEHNNQRSAHYGDGVYKSIDGGKTWTNMGLMESLHIGRIAIDPQDPSIVYVAAIGPLYKGGGERGVYKTTNGGNTWALVLKGANETTGFIDIAQDPEDRNVLYAAAYDRLRRAWNIRDNGPGSGIWKSKDSGKTWTRMTNGFPVGDRNGRIGITIYPKDPKIVYATLDNQAPGKQIEIYRTNDAGASWKKVNAGRADGSYYYGQIRVDPNNPERVYVLGVSFLRSDDGGKKYTPLARGVHVDHHALWIDPNNSERLLLGNDGGMYISHDAGETFAFINNLPIPQFYAVGVDNSVPYNVMGGLQDNGVWHGPSRTRDRRGISNNDWRSIYGGDGFYTVPDAEDPYTVYTSSQFGGVGRVDVKTGQTRGIKPREEKIRSNWMAPFMTSPHNSRIIYWGGNMLFRSLDRGDSWTAISTDLTTKNAEKIKGNVPHCTITTIDESPVRPGVLWVGTDDGNVWVSENGGVAWNQVNAKMPGAPKEWWVSRVFASSHDAGTAFVSYTGFREEDFTPYLYKTTDFGKTWTSLSKNLPKEQVSVVKQDTINPNLLVVGTEEGCQVSLNGGMDWHKLGNGLPKATPVQDLLIHPREGDLVIGTHGRGVYIVNISPLRQLKKEILDKYIHIFAPDRALATAFRGSMFDSFAGQSRFVAPNPENGATIAYYLRSAEGGDVKIEILGPDGGVLDEPKGTKNAGVNLVHWNMRSGGETLGAGSYAVRITRDGKSETSVLQVQTW
ncbi:MAG: WD40/YVTN/BNR-like repeat-containing protein [Fimbriimonadales bacterium]